MNRSILIVICDFLLISLLAFSTVDMNKVADQNADHRVTIAAATNQVAARQDLGNVMRLALDEERKTRDALMGELARTRGTLEQQQSLFTERERQTREMQQQTQALQQQTQTLQQQIEAREREAADLQRQREGLARDSSGAQTNIAALNQQLHATTVESVITKEGLAATEAEVKKQTDQAAALKQQLSQLEKSNQVVQVEKQQLATQLQVAQAEQHAATDLAARMQDEVKIEREEKSKLADGVKALATQSGQLAKEIHESRPLAANSIFNELVTNRVTANFHTFRPALLGIDGKRDRETETVLVTDGTNNFALCHVEDTPLTLGTLGSDWQTLTGTLSHSATLLPIRWLSFSAADPRVVLIPVTDQQARDLNCKIYHVSGDPFKFQDAVVVGAREGYYGESKFQIDLSTPMYVKMDHNSLKGLFGKFNPSHGDLVLSKNGDLLGIMANNTYCLVLGNFSTSATIQFGDDIRAEHTGATLSALYTFVTTMPFKLQ